jgi:hypothetical protein
MKLNKLLMLAVYAGALVACNSGGSSSSGGNNPPVVIDQWLQVGQAAEVKASDSLAYEPVNNLIFRNPFNTAQVCTIIGNAESSVPWSCVNITVNNQPWLSFNMATDNKGAMYSFIGTESAPVVMKFNSAGVLSSVPLNKGSAPTSNFDNIAFENDIVYTVQHVYTGNDGGISIFNNYLVAFDAATGQYISSTLINTGTTIINNQYYSISGGNIFIESALTGEKNAYSKALSNLSTGPQQYYTLPSLTSPIAAVGNFLYACSHDSAVGSYIYRLNLLNNSAWQSIGYSEKINDSGTTKVVSCFKIANNSYNSNAYIIGASLTSNSGYAVYAQPK